MPNQNEICLSKNNNSLVALGRIGKKKVQINCLQLLSYNERQVNDLRLECADAQVRLSLDLQSIKPEAFCLPDPYSCDRTKAAGFLFQELTVILEKSYSVTLPYYEEEGLDSGLNFPKENALAANFQLSRTLLQYFLSRGFHLDNQAIFRKHQHWKLLTDFDDKSNGQLVLNVLDTSQNYFSNTAEAIASFYTHMKFRHNDSSSALYLGFNSVAFKSPGDLAQLLLQLNAIRVYDRRPKEWVLVLRGQQYKDLTARDEVYKEIKGVLSNKTVNWGLFHVFLLTKVLSNPLSKAYPDYRRSPRAAVWTVLINESGYYLSDPLLFQQALNTQNQQLNYRLINYLVEEESKSHSVPKANNELPATLENNDPLNDKTNPVRAAPTITYTMQSQIQAEEIQEVQVAERLDQQLVSSLQQKKQVHFTKQSQSLFGVGVFHMNYQAFVHILTEALNKYVREQRAIRQKFKLYFANPDKTEADYLWGLGMPAVAAKKIASKVFGLGIVEYKAGHDLLKTPSSIKYIDNAYNTSHAIISNIEHYRDGFSFIKPMNSQAENRCFQWPMHVKGKKELVVTDIYYGDRVFDFKPNVSFSFQTSHLLSTLPLECNSEEARKAYYHPYNGQVLSKKDSDYSNRLMAFFLDESAQEQETCLNDYCSLYREYDNTEAGHALIRSFLKDSEHLKADIKQFLYVHIKGGIVFVQAMIALFKKLDKQGLCSLFYKLYFKKSDHIFSLFFFLDGSQYPLTPAEETFNYNQELFLSLPAKEHWLPYHQFLASFLLSFSNISLRSYNRRPSGFWTEIEALVHTYSEGYQQKTLALLARTLAGEEGLRIQGGCHPEIVFRAITKILASAGQNSTFFEQIDMLADLPMAWCDALYAIEEEGFRVVCREMKLETAFLNPPSVGQKLSNGYKVSRTDFEKALRNPPNLNAAISLETLVFRYLGTEMSRQSLGYYRLLFESTKDFKNQDLRVRCIAWFSFYTTGPFYNAEGKAKDADIIQQFLPAEKSDVSLLLKALQAIKLHSLRHEVIEHYQLKSLLDRTAHPASDALPLIVQQCLRMVIDKRHLNSFLHSQQALLQANGLSFGWIGLAFIEEALAEEAFFTTNTYYKERQKRFLQALLPSLNKEKKESWAAIRGSIHDLVKNTRDFLKFFTLHASYKAELGEKLYQGLMDHSEDSSIVETIIAVLLECKFDARVDFTTLCLFFESFSESSPLLKKNKAILARLAARTLKANPPTLEQSKWYARLGEHLLSCSSLSLDISLFNAIVTLSESTEAEEWLRLCCQLDIKQLPEAVTVFNLLNNHRDTLHFLKAMVACQKIDALGQWINKLKLANHNQRLFIFEIIYALMQKEEKIAWIQWTQALRDLPLAELSALVKLSKQAQIYSTELSGFIQSHTIIETMNDLERRQLKPLPEEVFAAREHSIEKINELGYKPSAGHRALALEHQERKDLWQDYLTLQSLILDKTQAIFVEELPNGSRQLRPLAELTEAEIQSLIVRILREWPHPSTPSFRKHDLELLLLALACVAMYRVIGCFPRDVQLLAVLNTMARPGHLIHEIATGEGKGITSALHAILVWGRGHEADITTINDKLAERDRKQFNPVYQYLGIPCHDAVISAETSPEIGQKRGIFYGIWSSFALLDTRLGFARPWTRSIICDEFDASINTTVEARLATSIDPIFQGKKKWEKVYDYLLDFVAEEKQASNLANCRKYLAARELQGLLKNPRTPKIPLLNDALLKDLLQASNNAHIFQENVHYTIVEKMVTKKKKRETYLYAAPILDSTKSPEASISWHWIQQLLHSKLNRAKNLPFPFEIENHAETVITISANDFFANYQKTGGKIYALTGTVGSLADVNRFFKQNKCLSFAHPSNEKNLREDHGIEGAYGQEAHFALIFEKLKQFSSRYHSRYAGTPAFLSIFATAKEVNAFYHYVRARDEDFAKRMQCYDGVDRAGKLSTEHFIKRAGKFNTITLTTESLARGADVKPSHPEGLFTFNCCTELTDSDFFQILGRSARAGAKGHCISLLDFKNLIPQNPNETAEAWFARHRQTVAAKQACLREERKPLQVIRYAVSSRLLNLKIALVNILKRQEGDFSTGESEQKFLHALNQLDQNIEIEYYRLLEQKAASIKKQLILFAVKLYNKNLQSVLQDYKLDEYQTFELPLPLAAIENLKELNDVSLRDLSILSNALSQLGLLAGNKAVCKGYEMAEKSCLQLEAYFKKQSSLQALLLSQVFNLYISKEAAITEITKVQDSLNGWLKSITDLKILGYSLLINHEEATEIEAWAKHYLETIKHCIQNDKWDEIQYPKAQEGIVKKYLDRLKSYIPSAKAGKGNALLRFAIKRILKPLIKKQNIGRDEMEQQLALLASAEALICSIDTALKNEYSLDTPLGLCLKGIRDLFKESIKEEAESDILKGLLRFLKAKPNPQNVLLGYLVQVLATALPLLDMPYSQTPLKRFADLSLREFFKPEILSSFLTSLTTRPLFLQLFEDKPSILDMIQRLREIPFSSFEKFTSLDPANKQVLHCIQVLAHPQFSSFLAALPKDATWKRMCLWYHSSAEHLAALPLPIQKAVEDLRYFEKEALRVQAASREKIRTLQKRYILSPSDLIEEMRAQDRLPPIPETLDAEPLELKPKLEARIIAPAMWGIRAQMVQGMPEKSPAFPPVKYWLKPGAPPQVFLVRAMRHISKTADARPLIQEAIKQIAAVLNDKNRSARQGFYYLENTLTAIKQWQIMDSQNPKAANYLPILKPALLTCMEGYRRGFGKNFDRYFLIRELIKKTQALNTAEEILELLVSTKHTLLEQDRKADDSFLHSFLGWRRNSNGKSRMLDHMDNMIAALSTLMVAEGKAAKASARIEQANLDMLRSVLLRKSISKEFQTQISDLVNKDPANSYLPPLKQAQHHLKKLHFSHKHLHAFFVSFQRTESFRQELPSTTAAEVHQV